MLHLWLLPAALIVAAVLVSIPLSKFAVWIMEGRYRPLPGFGWIERKIDSGPQDWKQYTAALLIFNVILFVWGYVVLALQPIMPLNPRQLGMLAPTTIFNSVASFMTNTNLQDYSGDVHFSNFSQIFFTISNQYISAAVGFCALAAIIDRKSVV